MIRVYSVCLALSVQKLRIMHLVYFDNLCSFSHTGNWSQKGCELATYNVTQTTCKCYHLTNFAILMDVHATEVTDFVNNNIRRNVYLACASNFHGGDVWKFYII